MASFKDTMMGTPGQIQALPSFSPEQQGLLGNLVGGLGNPISKMMQNLQGLLSNDPKAFEAFEAPYKSQFSEQTVPGIMEGLTSAGGGRSSAMGQQLGAAGAGLSQQLASLRGGLQQQAMGQLQGLMGQGMQSPFQYHETQGTEGLLGPLMKAIGSGVGMAGGAAGMAKLLPLLAGLL